MGPIVTTSHPPLVFAATYGAASNDVATRGMQRKSAGQMRPLSAEVSIKVVARLKVRRHITFTVGRFGAGTRSAGGMIVQTKRNRQLCENSYTKTMVRPLDGP